jgi:hypothetical protein
VITKEDRFDLVSEAVERFGSKHAIGFSGGDHRVAFIRCVNTSTRQIVMFAAVPPSSVDWLERRLMHYFGKDIVIGDFHCGAVNGEPCGRSSDQIRGLIAGITAHFMFSGDLIPEFLEARGLAYKAAKHGHRWPE